jgi:SAM-dependent methyltransferase
MRASADLPYPPLPLARRTGGLAGRPDPVRAYEATGAATRRALLEILPAEWSFEGKRVLDFGCGAGRTLRHFLAEAAAAEMWGADIDAASIAWLKGALSPPLHLVCNPADPPLGLDQGSFDLVWALSVFTHLTENSLAWLLELHRLLKPGGLLIASYMGRWNGEIFTREAWDEDRIGMNVLRRNQGWDDGGPTVLMSDWWVREHWGRAFEVRGVLPEVQWQTWVLLRKRDVALGVADLQKPADDPREYLALRHNLRQVEQDRELVIAELRAYYERSWSWRLTRPLRSAAARMRTRRTRPSNS